MTIQVATVEEKNQKCYNHVNIFNLLSIIIILDLARIYKISQPRYSIVFLFLGKKSILQDSQLKTHEGKRELDTILQFSFSFGICAGKLGRLDLLPFVVK